MLRVAISAFLGLWLIFMFWILIYFPSFWKQILFYNWTLSKLRKSLWRHSKWRLNWKAILISYGSCNTRIYLCFLSETSRRGNDRIEIGINPEDKETGKESGEWSEMSTKCRRQKARDKRELASLGRESWNLDPGGGGLVAEGVWAARLRNRRHQAKGRMATGGVVGLPHSRRCPMGPCLTLGVPQHCYWMGEW